MNQSRFLGRGCDEALFSEKKGFFSEKGGGNSVNEGFGKDFYRKGNSVKRSGPFGEPPDSENWKVAVLIPFPKISTEWIDTQVKIVGLCSACWAIAGLPWSSLPCVGIWVHCGRSDTDANANANSDATRNFPWRRSQYFSSRVLVETNFETSKTLLWKASWSLKNGLNWSTITKVRFPRLRTLANLCHQIHEKKPRNSRCKSIRKRLRMVLRMMWWKSVLAAECFLANGRLQQTSLALANAMTWRTPGFSKLLHAWDHCYGFI